MSHTEVIVYSSLLNFAVAGAILFFAGKKPFMQAMSKRGDDVSASMGEAAKNYETAKKEYDTWKTSFDNREKQIAQMRTDAEAAMKSLKEQTLSSANDQGERMKHDAKLLAESEQKRAQQGLLSALVNRSIRIVEDNLGDNLGAVEQSRLLNRNLEAIS